MKILVVDTSADGVPFTLRCQEAGHDVRIYQPPRTTGEAILAGKGLVHKAKEWKPLMRWADLIVMTSNHMYADDLEPFFEKGFPIIGANKKAAALELDRALGDRVLNTCGIKTIPFEVFDSIDQAISHVQNDGETYVCKSWGGVEDKSLSFVSKSAADMVFKLKLWKKQGKAKGRLMLQKKVKGMEMAVAAWFGPGGFSAPINEIFEHKKFLNEDLGQNTGEMGTVMRYVSKSKLFDEVLKPCEDYLHGTGYVGNVDVNCMVDRSGTPWPLEFTMRFGWPGFNLSMALHKGDPAAWLGDLLEGRDTLQVKEEKVCVGVVMAHGDFPNFKWCPEDVSGFPISGVTEAMEKHVWPQWVMLDRAPVMVGEKVKEEITLCTAGHIPFTVTGVGDTIEAARETCYKRVWAIDWPSNRMFRTDIGCRLEDGLTSLQLNGFAKGMRYD